MSRPFRLLLGVGSYSGFSETVTYCVRTALPPATPFTVTEFDFLADMRQAKVEEFDLAVLLLNNVITKEGCCWAGVLLVLDTVREFSADGLPVITMCGLSEHPEVADLAIAAGAKLHVSHIGTIRAFQDAVRQCVPEWAYAAELLTDWPTSHADPRAGS
jgi:hypothetical protein